MDQPPAGSIGAASTRCVICLGTLRRHLSPIARYALRDEEDVVFYGYP